MHVVIVVMTPLPFVRLYVSSKCARNTLTYLPTCKQTNKLTTYPPASAFIPKLMQLHRLLRASIITTHPSIRQPAFRRAPFSSTIPSMATEFKLKDISSLDLRNGEKKEVEVEGVEGAKVLLLKVQDKVHASSSNCTHYGAPLVKGILSPDGRLTCPWHGGMLLLFFSFMLRLKRLGLTSTACFKVATGDVEDAPALDPILKYDVFERDGAVYVKTDEEKLKANRGALNAKCSAVSEEKVLVIGGYACHCILTMGDIC